MRGKVKVEVELFLAESGFHLTIVNVESQVQEDLILGWVCEVPGKSREVVEFFL